MPCITSKKSRHNPIHLLCAVAYSLLQKFKSNREEWSEFGQHIQDSVACIIQTIPNVAIEPQTDMRKKVENLHS